MKKILLCFLVFGMLQGEAFAASKYSDVSKGNILYKEGEFEEALKRYKNALSDAPDSDIINFNIGAALYKNGDYAKATDHFSKALLSKNVSIEQKANYNIGNAKYKEGISKENTDLPKAIELLEQSLGYYEQTIKLDRNDEDAAYNYEFVKKELERLKQKQQEEQQKEDKQCPLGKDKEEEESE